MGYVFLLISVFAGATKGYCGKKTSDYTTEYKDAVLANSIRMFFCTVIGLLITAVLGGISGIFAVNITTVLIILLSSVANSAFVVLWLVCVKRGAYMMLDVFCMLGVFIPMFGCSIFFDEKIGAKHIISVVLLVLSVCIMCSYNNLIKEKISVTSLILLLLCAASNGLYDFSQKLFVKTSENVSIATFNFYTYLFSFVILICCYFVFSKNSTKQTEFKIKPIFAYLLVMSVCLFAYSYFKTLAAQRLSAALLYPLAQGSSLILSTIMSAVFFKERLNIRCVIGIIIAFIAICLNVSA